MTTPENTYEANTALAKKFHQCLLTADWDALRDVLAPDVEWSLPGDNRISGPARGVDAVIERVRLIASFGPSFTLEHILVSRDDMALAVHNTATREGRVLDEHLATVCRVEGGKVTFIETYLSDVDGMNAFFV